MAELFRAGPLAVDYENGQIRYIRLGDREIVRGIYAALRDHNWATIGATLSDVVIDKGADWFRVSFRATHQRGDIDFVWDGVISGAADGTIRFDFDGEARSTFRRNRIGFCVLHPMELAGQPCLIEHVDGTTTDGAFPQSISPHQPYFDIRAMSHTVMPEVRARVLMEGDTFEIEDQRNWSDASYKTYCTPLRLPYPATVEAGTRIHQTITVTVSGDLPQNTQADEAGITFTLGEAVHPLPGIGLMVADTALTAGEIERLRALRLSHLRVTLRPAEADTEQKLRQAAHDAQALGVGLEVAVYVTDAESLAALQRLVAAIQPPVIRWLALDGDGQASSAESLALAREHLGGVIGGGSDAFFTEFNRQRPPLDLLDFVAYSVNPQVHAFDDLTLVETLAAQGATVESAKEIAPGKPVHVGPVTFKMRWNPNATGPQPAPAPGELPAPVDPRQLSPFGAAWTLGSIKHLAQSGAAGITYYETVGWLGVMERESGSPLPGKFPSQPGAPFPLYQVFADVAGFPEVIATQSSAPLRVDGLALRNGAHVRLLLANFGAETQTVMLRGFPFAENIITLAPYTIHKLDHRA